MAAPYGPPIYDPSDRTEPEPSAERFAEIERFTVQHLQERGIDRATLRHDVYCYELVFDLHQIYCLEMSARQALRSLPEPEARQIAAILGFSPPPRGTRYKVPEHLDPWEVGAAVCSHLLGFDPLLTYAEFWAMLARTTLSINARYGYSIIGTRLWLFMVVDEVPEPSYEQMRQWLEELGVVPAPETRALLRCRSPRPRRPRSPA